ncbi:MAG TPA: alpha/beta hydrolase [Thermoleophilaceae bacterium]
MTSATASTEQRAQVGELELAYETIGDPSDPPLLLVMGLGMQLIHWQRELCETLAQRGFYVIRFDNRDAGRSTQINAPVPNLLRGFVGLRIDAPYRLEDMAADTLGLLDRIGVERAHVVGASMGGMIAQTLAIVAPQRVLSLGSIMSTTGARNASRPKPHVWRMLLARAPREREAYIEHFVRLFTLIGSPRYPADPAQLREMAGITYDRGSHPAGTARQLAAIIASGDRTSRLRMLDVPAVVIHGREDPLVRFRGGEATARAIPGARLVAFDGMGHDLPPELWPEIVAALVANTERAVTPQAA